ncbi:MAG TPA: hypothetical protein VK324_14690 [Tepidisphaeraceae bacterium]|nr:hypothetical protein [Tepidisphaeraceae bacterium]
MTRTYQAILKGDRLEWTGDAPTMQGPLAVQVTVVAPVPYDDGRRRQLAEALEDLARANPFREITDPAAWQREIRKDRPLPGRE